jgi:hypothetical protein
MARARKLELGEATRRSLAAKKNPVLLDVPPGRFLTAEGTGDPATEGFTRAVGAIFGVAWTVKMTGKAAGKDFKVGALEGLWWGGGPEDGPRKRRTWRWKLLLRVPDSVGAADVRRAAGVLAARGRDGTGVRVERFAEGRAVQVLHVGPYADEPATLERLEAYARGEGLAFTGPHHELYLSDPRRTAPSRLRTILRHAVRPIARRVRRAA